MINVRRLVGEEHQQEREFEDLLVKNTNKSGAGEHQQERGALCVYSSVSSVVNAVVNALAQLKHILLLTLLPY